MSNRILPIPMGSGGPGPENYYTKAEIDAMLLNYAQLATTDLANYYLKTQTYTQQEIQNLIGQITSFEVVSTLPVSDIKTNVIYLVGPTGTGADKYDEYIYSNSQWVKIGETSVDLSNYVTVNQLNTALGFYTTTFDLNTLLAGKQDTLTAGTGITISSNVISADSNVISMTQAQYDALGTNVNPDAIYIITDATPVTLATVASTGSYNDLTDKPAIPVLATVATTGDYNDLSNTPSIPTVGTGTVTLTSGGTTIGTINVNDTADKTIDIPGGGGDTEEIEQAIAAAINDTRDTINQDLYNNYVRTQDMNDALKPYATKAALDAYSSKSYVDTAIGTVTTEIEDKERATSFALNDLNEALNNTVALTFTLDGIGTVTYNVVINE